MASRSLGSLTLDLIAKTGGFTGPIDKAARDLDKQTKGMSKSLDGFASSLKTIGAGIAGFVGGAAIAGFTGLAVGIKKTVDAMDELSKSAQKVGVTTEELSKLAYAGDLADVSLETLTSSLGKLTKAQAEALDASSKTAKVFDALGIAVKDADGNLRSSTDVLGDFAEQFQKLGGSPEATAAGFQLFGRSFQELIPLLKDGREGIEAAGDELERFGGVITTQAGQAAEEFNDNLTRLKTQFSSIFAQVAQQLLPILVELSEDLQGFAKNGDLARNATTLLSTAFELGVGAVKLYNEAVERTSIALEAFVGLAKTSASIGAQVLTLGLADGTVAGSVRGYIGTLKELDKQLEDVSKRQAQTRVPIPGLDEIDFSRGAPLSADESAKANRRLGVALADVTEKKKASAKASKELTEEEKRFREEILEVNDLIDEQVQGAQSDIFFDRQGRAEDREAYLADIQLEAEFLGKTAEQQEILNNLRYAGVDAESAFGQAIVQATTDLQEQRKAIEDQVTVMDTFREGFETAFGDVITGTKSVKEAFTDLIDQITSDLLRFVAQNLIEKAFGQTGSTATGSAGGWLSAFASIFTAGRATGGSVNSGGLYRVNENEPELLTVGGRDYLMMGGASGMVSSGRGAGVSQSNTFYLAAPTSQRTQEQIAQRSAFELQQAQRRNG